MRRLIVFGLAVLLVVAAVQELRTYGQKFWPYGTAAPILSATEPAFDPDEQSQGSGAGRPELPRVYLDTSVVPPSGRVIAVAAESRGEAVLRSVQRVIGLPAGGRLQAALNAAQPGDVVELPAGTTFAGNFVLSRRPGAGWITIRSSAHERLPPPGTRIAPGQAHLMPRIVTPNRSPVLRTAAGAHHFRLVGLEMTTTWTTRRGQIHAVVDLSRGSNIIIDRSYIHGTPTGNVRTGVMANGAAIAVIDSYISDIHHAIPGYDAAAIWVWNGPGPFKIVNNYLEASAVNLFFGGSDPTVRNLVPSDIEIRGNHFFKPLSWREGDPAFAGIVWNVKNLFELKNARRVLVDGNVFENNWAQNQDGIAILLTPRNQEGTAPWSCVQDVTFTNNIVSRNAGGFYILGWDNLSSGSQQTQRVLIRNNLFLDIGAFPSGRDNSGTLFIVSDGPRDLVIDHNTAFQTNLPILVDTKIAGRWPGRGFTFTNNIANNIAAEDWWHALQPLRTYFPDGAFARNVLIGEGTPLYPPDNRGVASLHHVGFVNPAAGDYRLVPDSPFKRAGTDGRDIGADIDAIVAAVHPWAAAGVGR